MLLIHLITDLGNTDPYLSQFSGQLHKHLQNFRIASQLTGIKPYDIREGAHVLQNAYRHFPEHTIHIAHINILEGKKRVLLCAHNNHYFISFDHGLLPLALSVPADELFLLNEEWIEPDDSMRFVAIARACSLLERKFSLKDIGTIPDRIVPSKGFEPFLNDKRIQAIVQHVDHFGNLILNIKKTFWNTLGLSYDVTLLINRMECRGITDTPEAIEDGEIFCFFNNSDLLVVSLRNGNASRMLGVLVDDSVVIALK